MSAVETSIITKLWRVIDYLANRPQGTFSAIDDSRIFAHSVRYVKNAIETLDKDLQSRLIAQNHSLLESLKKFVALANFDADTLPKTNEEWDAMVAEAEAAIRQSSTPTEKEEAA